MPKELFGTDGIRGTPGEYPLDDRTLFWIGRTLGDYLGQTGASPRRHRRVSIAAAIVARTITGPPMYQ